MLITFCCRYIDGNSKKIFFAFVGVTLNSEVTQRSTKREQKKILAPLAQLIFKMFLKKQFPNVKRSLMLSCFFLITLILYLFFARVFHTSASNPKFDGQPNQGFGSVNCEVTENDVGMDTAVLKLSNNSPLEYEVYYVSENCYNCTSRLLMTSEDGIDEKCGLLNTDYDVSLTFFSLKSPTSRCEVTFQPQAHVVYLLEVTEDSGDNGCSLSIDKSGEIFGYFFLQNGPVFFLVFFVLTVAGVRRSVCQGRVRKKIKLMSERAQEQDRLLALSASFMDYDGNRNDTAANNSNSSAGSAKNMKRASDYAPLFERKDDHREIDDDEDSIIHRNDDDAPILNDTNRVDKYTEQMKRTEFGQELLRVDNKPVKKRLSSLDTFRGISLCLMVFVNYGGGGYYWLNHSSWDGLTVADILFPWFVWISGCVHGLTYKNYDRRRWHRCIKLLVIGLVLNSKDSSGHLGLLRIPGVLQYFALASAFLTLISSLAEHEKNIHTDVTYVGVGLVPLILYIFISFFMQADGCPAGYHGAGGLQDLSTQYDCTGGSHRSVDVAILGENHFYQNPTCKSEYECLSYDPEGLTGGLTACFLAFLGLVTGKLIKTYKLEPWWVVGMLVSFGIVLCGIGGVMCEGSQHGGISPVNKNLWSPSFVILMAGGGNIVLALLYYLVDMQPTATERLSLELESVSGAGGRGGGKSLFSWNVEKMYYTGWPFKQVGHNSILVYVGHEVLAGYIPFSIYFDSDLVRPTHWGIMISNVIGVTCWICIGVYMYNKNVTFSV